MNANVFVLHSKRVHYIGYNDVALLTVSFAAAKCMITICDQFSAEYNVYIQLLNWEIRPIQLQAVHLGSCIEQIYNQSDIQ